MTSINDIFQVDTKGMGAQARRRGLAALVYELWQNAVDEDGVTMIEVCIRPVEGRGMYELSVEDDAPDGFRDLSESYTLYAPSAKRNDPEKRGQFNVGEKYVIAACVGTGGTVEIRSTTGLVAFSTNGRYPSRARRNAGTAFKGTLRANRQDVEAALESMRRVIVPEHIRATINGEALQRREAVATIKVNLPTWHEGEDGDMTRTRRDTTVSLYEPLPGTAAMLYEMGIPVVETGDRYDVDVAQKVMLTSERDNVTPTYLAAIRSATLNAAVEANDLTTEDTTTVWVKQALGDKHTTDEAVRQVMDLRYGRKRVSYDPSDPEANGRAVEQGYKLIYGPMHSSAEWDNIRRASAIKPAGQVTPSNKIEFGDGEPERVVDPSKYPIGMRRIVDHALWLGKELLGTEIRVQVINEPIRRANMLARFGGTRLTFNVGTLGYKWFEHDMSDPEVSDILIHEYGHWYSEDHLSAKYHDALSSLGARMVKLALDYPGLFVGNSLA